MAIASAAKALVKARAICVALPGTSEKLSHGAPAWFVSGKQYAAFANDHHGDGRLALWCAAPDGAQAMLVDSDPDGYFLPPYVAHRGWIGVRLDRDADWAEIAELCQDAYRVIAPARLAARLDG